MAEASLLVVDASVAAKWELNDESHAQRSLAVLEDFRSGKVVLYAPDQIRYEVPSAILKAVRQRRLSPERGQIAVALFLSLDLTTVRSNSLIMLAYRHALHFGCSLYDGLYLALAETAQCPLVYADARLRTALHDRFPWAMWIEDYS